MELPKVYVEDIFQLMLLALRVRGWAKVRVKVNAREHIILAWQ